MTMTPPTNANGLLSVKKVPVWRALLSAGCYFVFYFVIQFAVSIAYGIYLAFTLPLEGLSEEARDAMLEQASFEDGNYLMIIMDLLIFLILAIVFLARGKTFHEGMGMKKTKISNVLLAFVAGLGLTCALGFVMILIEAFFPALMEDYNNTMDATYNIESLLPYIIAGVIGAPLIEELIFRHLISGRLSRGIPRGLAILIGSVLFGIVHGHPVQWVYAGVLGFVMACVYFAYDCIWIPVAMHAGFNSLSVLAYLEAIEMNETQQALFGGMLLLAEVAFIAFGSIALTFLFIRREHPVFRKEKSAVSPAPAPQPVQSIYKQYDLSGAGSAIPTVAAMSETMSEAATPTLPADNASATSDAPVEPIAPVEASSANEAGGKQ